MLASDVIDRARLILQDVDGIRWLDQEAYKWLTDGQRVIVLARPDACSTNAPAVLVAGTRQTLPTGALRLLDVIRNVNGRAIRYVDREILDTADPNWHMQPPSLVIRNYCYDGRDALTFYVSPPAMADAKTNKFAKIEMLYSRIPVPVTALDDILDVPDIYADPLLNYFLFRCYSKEAQFAQNMQLSSAYLQTFMGMIGMKTKKEVAFSPDLTNKGAAPNAEAIKMEGL